MFAKRSGVALGHARYEPAIRVPNCRSGGLACPTRHLSNQSPFVRSSRDRPGDGRRPKPVDACISWDQLPCGASSPDDEVDLEAGPKRQRSHPDRRAGGKRLAEMLCVDPIHCDEVAHVREIHPGARNVIETPAGRLENRCEIPKDTLCLGLDTSFDHLASGRVLADLTAEVEEATDFDCLGKRADRWREFGRDNCSLAHGTLTPVDTGLHP